MISSPVFLATPSAAWIALAVPDRLVPGMSPGTRWVRHVLEELPPKEAWRLKFPLKPKLPLLVVAGNHDQYRQYLRARGDRPSPPAEGALRVRPPFAARDPAALAGRVHRDVLEPSRPRRTLPLRPPEESPPWQPVAWPGTG
jgi:hypothetical protein